MIPLPPAKVGSTKRRAVSHQLAASSADRHHHVAHDDNTPPPPPLLRALQAVEVTHDRPSTNTVSVQWHDATAPGARSASLKMQTECIESETITTTKITKRTYSPLTIPEPQALRLLNSKEYPLATAPIPPRLSCFSYDVLGSGVLKAASRSVSLMAPKPTSSQASPAYLHPSSQRVHRAVSASNVPSGRRTTRGRSLRHQSIRCRTPDPDVVKDKLRSITANAGRAASRLSNSETASSSRTISNTHASRRGIGLGLAMADQATLPATPEMSELDTSQSRLSQQTSFEDAITPRSGVSVEDELGFFDAVSTPSHSNAHPASASAVATPPIAEDEIAARTDADHEVSQPLWPSRVANDQSTSLPSPGLSPTSEFKEFVGPSDPQHEDLLSPITQSGDEDELELATNSAISKAHHLSTRRHANDAHDSAPLALFDAQRMVETFDLMPEHMKELLMYQCLRRCHKKTLQLVASVVNPALKCDFLEQLPGELSLHILSFLDYKDLCRAAQVSKQWRNVVDTNETGWKELFDHDGYTLPLGELEKAITQGWGWQDPYGPEGHEMDLSTPEPIKEKSDVVITAVVKVEQRRSRPLMKRKRPAMGLSSDRSKRRSSGPEGLSKSRDLLARYPYTARYHKSEGPNTAASAAALAVPDPQIGLPSLRKLHLFKSLYRRHHLLRRSWTDGKSQPQHLAFPAHPAHVITCLQFDDDKIITGSDDTLIHVYDTKTGVLRKKLMGHEGGVWALQYEGNVLVSGSTDRSVRVWDIEKGLCTQVFHGHTSTVRCLQILLPESTGAFEQGKPVMRPERPIVITGSRDSQLRVWKLPEQGSRRYIQSNPSANDTDCPYFIRTLVGHTHSVRAIAAHSDTLVSGSYDHTVRVWKISTGEVVHKLEGHAMKVYSVVLDHKRNRCISGSMDQYVKIWSLDTGTCLYTLEGHGSLVGLLDLNMDRLVSAAADSTLRIWDPENGVCKNILSAHTGAITCFQHDGQKVISGSDRTLKMWNIKTGECIEDLLSDLSGVWQVRFDERRCVAAVQRDNLTFVEVLDFGAVRDGVPASQRGVRTLLGNGGDLVAAARNIQDAQTLLTVT